MIGKRFAKPLQDDNIKISVTKTVTISEEVQVGYPVEREIPVVVQTPIYKVVTTDEGEKLEVISGYSESTTFEKVTELEYRTETRTREEEQPVTEVRPNPAPNTYTRYREAVQWCNENGAMIMEGEPTKEYPNGYYEVQAIPAPSIEALRTTKLHALNSAFATVEEDAWVQSSLGFKADANTTANTNIDGLIKSMTASGSETTMFCDYDNEFHAVTLDNLKTLQLEVIQNGQSLYAQKWVFREAINAAQSKEALDAVVITFTMMDFSV